MTYEPAPSPGAAALSSEPRLYFRREEMEPEAESEATFGTWEDLWTQLGLAQVLQSNRS